MFDCLRYGSLKVFDKMITSDDIPLTLDIRLKRKQHGQHNNGTERSDTALAEESWSEHILENIVNLHRTHTLNIDFTQSSVSGRGYTNKQI